MKKFMLAGLLAVSAVGSMSPDGAAARGFFGGAIGDLGKSTGQAAVEDVTKFVTLPYVAGRVMGQIVDGVMPGRVLQGDMVHKGSRMTLEAGCSALAVAALLKSPWVAYSGAGAAALGAAGMHVSRK